MGTETTYEGTRELEGPLADLARSAPVLAALSAAERADLARACLGRVPAAASEWVALTCAAKRIPAGDRWVGEEVAMGPAPTARYLRLVIGVLDDVARHGAPTPPATPRTDTRGRLRVPVIPAKGMFDGIAFKGFSAEVVMQEGVTAARLSEHMGRPLRESLPGVTTILGAGNLSALALCAMASETLLHGRASLVKLHPHYASLAPLLERVFAPLIGPGYVRFVAGGGTVGAAACADPRVGRVHMTGAVETFESLVWGDGEKGERRREADAPVLDKELVVELGNVTPWIVVPGPWSDKDLRFQAENLAGAIMSNASFNCTCPKVVITSRSWPQRERFLELVRGLLASLPPRAAYYAGATERYLELVGEPAGAAPGCLPWTLLRDVDPDERPELFEQENFVSVSAETSLDVADPAEFLGAAARFVNERVAGTLAVTVVVHPSQRRAGPVAGALEQAIADLRYGTVSINHFAGLAWWMLATPWGGFPGATPADPESGFGFSNNTLLLDGIEKTVFEGPFRVSPKPIIFPSNRNVAGICGALTELYAAPSAMRVPKLLVQALKG